METPFAPHAHPLTWNEKTPHLSYFVIFGYFYDVGNVWYVRRIMTWVRHCTCVPSLPPYEGLMGLGYGKFDDEELVMINLVDGIVNEF